MIIYQLLQWKSAIKLEKLGMRHSRGRSCRKHAALQLGLPPNSGHDVVIAEIERLLVEVIAERAEESDKCV